MAERVGKIHIHDLPYNRDLPVRYDVYRCHCGTEFIVDDNKESGYSKSPVKWTEISGNMSVEYDRTVNGEQFIGRAGPDTVFDEEAPDGQGSTGSGDSDESEGISTPGAIQPD